LTAHDTVPGYRFLRWNDHNTDNPRTVVVTQDTIFTAFFSRQQGIDSPLSPLPAFTLSPNPAHTSVTVTLAAPCGSGCSLSLLDASGHTVLSLPLPAGSSNATLPLRDLPAGPYFVSLSSPQGSSSQKLILQ
ncbi:MAG: T9SS type A sorting domain-containing protein, partial [Bacteroidales bacterium]|nr:T9SS type A sorting domain-containing protein [Bacteroidales bacterium]